MTPPVTILTVVEARYDVAVTHRQLTVEVVMDVCVVWLKHSMFLAHTVRQLHLR